MRPIIALDPEFAVKAAELILSDYAEHPPPIPADLRSLLECLFTAGFGAGFDMAQDLAAAGVR
jgi:hypothetical protein